MNTQKKNSHNQQKVSSFVKKLTMLLYIVMAILSMLHHNIDSINNLITEVILYMILGLGVYMIVDSISIKNIKKNLNILFDD